MFSLSIRAKSPAPLLAALFATGFFLAPHTASAAQPPAATATAPWAFASAKRELTHQNWASQSLGYVRTFLGPVDFDAFIGSEPTAVYDITARTVFMPDGARLEAHSGLRERADNPLYVNVRNRGSTPPALYKLILLDYPFHGVTTIRLTPISGSVFGRTDLLAHTYMWRGRSDSLGCVVFPQYSRFLKAFQLGRVKRLRVVPGLGKAALWLARA